MKPNKITSIIKKTLFFTVFAAITVTIIVALSGPVDLSDTGQNLGAPALVGYRFAAKNDGQTLVIGPSKDIRQIIVFADYSESSSTHYLVKPQQDGTVISLEAGNLIFVRTKKGVTSFVYMWNFSNNAEVLVVNGVPRNSWDPDNGYTNLTGNDPMFTRDWYWKYGIGR